MIRSFAELITENLWRGLGSRRLPPEIADKGLAKLRLVDAAVSLDDLRSPPGNRLELLKGERKGQYSIRINDQFRVCFVWTAGGPEQVEIVDYH